MKPELMTFIFYALMAYLAYLVLLTAKVMLAIYRGKLMAPIVQRLGKAIAGALLTVAFAAFRNATDYQRGMIWIISFCVIYIALTIRDFTRLAIMPKNAAILYAKQMYEQMGDSDDESDSQEAKR